VSVWLVVAIVCRWARQRPLLVVDVGCAAGLCLWSPSSLVKPATSLMRPWLQQVWQATQNCSSQLSSAAQLLGGKPSANSHYCQNPILGLMPVVGPLSTKPR
jgi:hypothetical protein